MRGERETEYDRFNQKNKRLNQPIIHITFKPLIEFFDRSLTSQTIELSNENRTSKKTNYSLTVALINHNLSSQDISIWSIKIVNIKNWIGVGVGIHSVLKKDGLRIFIISDKF